MVTKGRGKHLGGREGKCACLKKSTRRNLVNGALGGLPPDLRRRKNAEEKNLVAGEPGRWGYRTFEKKK